MVALVEHQRRSFLIFDWTMRPLVAPRVLQNSITRLKKIQSICLKCFHNGYIQLLSLSHTLIQQKIV